MFVEEVKGAAHRNITTGYKEFTKMNYMQKSPVSRFCKK
jgi:hypothetical protein